jgi:DNA-binding transcriptional LysR family regulator
VAEVHVEIEFRHVRAFVAVAEELHFTRAAERLHVAQPALSQQIKQLESAVGATLLVRGPGGTALSDAGRAFLAEARRTLAQAEAAVTAARRAHRGEIGRLRVGYTPTASSQAFLPVLAAYQRGHPQVELSLRELPIGDPSDLLRSNVVDLAFAARIGPFGNRDAVAVTDVALAEIALAEIALAEIAVAEIADDPFVVAVPADHRLAGRGETKLADLADEPFAMQSRDQCAEYHDALHSACLRAGFSPRRTHTTTEVSAQLALVAAGLAVALVPASTRVLRAADVRYLGVADDEPHIISLATWRSRDDGPVLRRLLDLLGPSAPPNARAGRDTRRRDQKASR